MWFLDSASNLHRGQIEGEVHMKGLFLCNTSIVFYFPNIEIQKKAFIRGAIDFQIQEEGNEIDRRMSFVIIEKE